MRASDLKIGQRFIAHDKEFICCGPCDNGAVASVDASGKDYFVCWFLPEYPIKLPEPDLPPLPDGYELAPDDHVLDGDSYRIDGCDPEPRDWLLTNEKGMTVKELKARCTSLKILAVARRKQPKHRPYNTDEMRALVGRIVVCDEGDYHLVTDWDKEDDTVYIADRYYCADDVLADFKTLDGQPCGVAE